MITDSKDYLKLLSLIQNKDSVEMAVLLPPTETIYSIDLNTRTIKGPEYLSVATDHKSETIYFKIARYFDGVDLSTKNCIVQYINANGDSGLYIVPFYDVWTYEDTQEMLFPWVIEGGATAAAGTVTFAVQFFEVTSDAKSYSYNLNTLTTQSKVLQGNNFDKTAVGDKINGDFDKTLDELSAQEIIELTGSTENLATAYEALISKMHKIEGELNLYWINV